MTASDTALVFDIKRFAVHDGDGIRTTVFLKGCPLRCRWCQNPEGLEMKPALLYMKTKCLHCGSCAKTAVNGEVTWEEDHPVINRAYEGSYDNVLKACPSGALVMDSQRYTEDELLARIQEDRVFFRDTGGVTFSGGEPLLQGAFLVNLLQRCQEAGIKTAIETSLSVSSEIVKGVLPHLDQIYADLKCFDGERHKQQTGQSNDLILNNIRILLESEQKDRVTIRTPLIPGATADRENIRAIASFLTSIYPDVRYELLNYNVLAPAKYEMTGKTYGMEEGLKRFSESEMEVFRTAARDGGITNLIQEKKTEGE